METDIKTLCDGLEDLLRIREGIFVREPTNDNENVCLDLYAAVLSARRLLKAASAPPRHEAQEARTDSPPWEATSKQFEINAQVGNRLLRLETLIEPAQVEINRAVERRISELEKDTGRVEQLNSLLKVHNRRISELEASTARVK